MLNQMLADTSISVTELKKNPMCVLEAGSPVAVLHHNKPAYYCVPSNVWEAIIEQLEDRENSPNDTNAINYQQLIEKLTEKIDISSKKASPE